MAMKRQCAYCEEEGRIVADLMPYWVLDHHAWLHQADCRDAYYAQVRWNRSKAPQRDEPCQPSLL